MAGTSTGLNTIGIVKGTTWGTAAAITGATLCHGRYSLSNSRGEFTPSDVGFNLFIEEITKLEETVDVTIDVELFYGSHGTMLLAMVLGDDVSTETTTDQDDYAHVMDMQEKNDGLFTTMVASYGDASTEVLEFPSVKWHTVRVTHATNDVARLQAVGIADRVVVSSAVNNLAALAGATYQDYDDFDDRYAVLAGANHYFRINAASGDALSSSNDLQILNYNFEIVRTLERDFPLRGAATRYTVEPKQLDPSRGTLTFQLHQIDHSKLNMLNLWDTSVKQKASLYYDGSPIGTGVNRSFRYDFPKLEASGTFPLNYDLPNNNTRMRPQITMHMLRSSAAPAGMTGITDYIRATAVNERAADYV